MVPFISRHQEHQSGVRSFSFFNKKKHEKSKTLTNGSGFTSDYESWSRMQTWTLIKQKLTCTDKLKYKMKQNKHKSLKMLKQNLTFENVISQYNLFLAFMILQKPKKQESFKNKNRYTARKNSRRWF